MKYTLIILSALLALVAISFAGCIDESVDGDQTEQVQTPAQSELPQSIQGGPIGPGGTQCGPFTCGIGTHGCNCSCGNARCVPDGLECPTVCL